MEMRKFCLVFCEMEIDMEIYNKFMAIDKPPTSEELLRKFTIEEELEICKRLKVRVRMDRWNPVHDYVRYLKKRGRYENKTPLQVQNFLTAAVNLHKPSCLYSEEEINAVRQTEWEQRKKYNILRLNVWEYDRKRLMESEVCSIGKKTEEVNVGNGADLSGNIQTCTESENSNYDKNKSIIEGNKINDVDDDDFHQPCEASNSMIICNTDTERTDNQEDFDKQSTVVELNSDKGENVDNNNKISESYKEKSAEFFVIDTESLTLTNSIDVDLESANVERFPFDEQLRYEEFHVSIPTTSTQNLQEMLEGV